MYASSSLSMDDVIYQPIDDLNGIGGSSDLKLDE